MSEPEQEAPRSFEFHWNASADDKTENRSENKSESKSGDGLQNGLEAFGKLMEGIAKMAGGLGAETIRNGIAANWLDGVATCLEDAIKVALESGQPPAERCGEVACFLERVEVELKDTKFAFQVTSFRERLREASQILERMQSGVTPPDASADVRKLGNIAGYFRAAAGTRPTPTEKSSGDAPA